MMLALPLLAVAGAPADPPIPADGVRFNVRITRSYDANYLVSLPEGYDPKGRKRWPLIVFLHGAGERGNNLEQVRMHGPFKELAKGRKFPFILVAPQCPTDTWWDPEVLSKMLTLIERKHRVDKDRMYLTGLSMGGYGTWIWSALEPNRFAAIAPICGGGNPADAPKIAHLPTWVTHGDKDGAVPIRESIAMVDAMKAAGAPEVRFDIIKGGEHDVWTPVYEGTALYDWFLTKTRRK